MDASVTAALISGVGVIIVAWVGLLGSKKGTLASAEKEFRTTILADNKELRDRVADLEKKFATVVEENSKLKIELAQIKAERSEEDDEDEEKKD